MKTDETRDPQVHETLDELRRRVAWQVHAAYGVQLPEEAKVDPTPESQPAARRSRWSWRRRPQLQPLPTVD